MRFHADGHFSPPMSRLCAREARQRAVICPVILSCCSRFEAAREAKPTRQQNARRCAHDGGTPTRYAMSHVAAAILVAERAKDAYAAVRHAKP